MVRLSAARLTNSRATSRRCRSGEASMLAVRMSVSAASSSSACWVTCRVRKGGAWGRAWGRAWGLDKLDNGGRMT